MTNTVPAGTSGKLKLKLPVSSRRSTMAMTEMEKNCVVGMLSTERLAPQNNERRPSNEPKESEVSEDWKIIKITVKPEQTEDYGGDNGRD